MEFGIEKCVMLIMKNERKEIIECIELSNQERIRTFREKENCINLDIMEEDTK